MPVTGSRKVSRISHLPQATDFCSHSCFQRILSFFQHVSVVRPHWVGHMRKAAGTSISAFLHHVGRGAGVEVDVQEGGVLDPQRVEDPTPVGLPGGAPAFRVGDSTARGREGQTGRAATCAAHSPAPARPPGPGVRPGRRVRHGLWARRRGGDPAVCREGNDVKSPLVLPSKGIRVATKKKLPPLDAKLLDFKEFAIFFRLGK